MGEREPSQILRDSRTQNRPRSIIKQLFMIDTSAVCLSPLAWVCYQWGMLSVWLIFPMWVMISLFLIYIYRHHCLKYCTTNYIYKYGAPLKHNAQQIMDRNVVDHVIQKVKELLICFAIGIFMTLGFSLLLTPMYQLGMFIISLSIYHYLEYLFWLFFHFDDISVDSFLINQSTEYGIAMTVAFVEFVVEYLLVSPLKLSTLSMFLTVCGLLWTIIGQYFRVSAEFTAKSNFTHQISFQKKTSHELVTHGVYAFSRHPSYFGWFLWSVSTQVMIWNPIWAVGFCIASHTFFKSRIQMEEKLLTNFFGTKYILYKQKVPTRIPFID